MGSGIGVTPFSGILADLQAREVNTIHQSSDAHSEKTAIADPVPSNTDNHNPSSVSKQLPPYDLDTYRRVDFHWIVKVCPSPVFSVRFSNPLTHTPQDRNSLLWFSNLLNTITRSRTPTLSSDITHSPHLDIRIQTHVTQKRKSIATHIFRCLLEQHRTPEHPASPLTGLLNATHFGRPDLARIMDEHYESMRALLAAGKGTQRKGRKVGVFFCGAPVIGYQLADRCWRNTQRGREDGNEVEYHFMMEVFG